MQLCRIFPSLFVRTEKQIGSQLLLWQFRADITRLLIFFKAFFLTVKKTFLSLQQLYCTIIQLLTVLSGICSANCRNRISGRHNQLIAVARVVGRFRLTQDKVEKIQPEQNNGLQVNEIYHIIRLFKLS